MGKRRDASAIHKLSSLATDSDAAVAKAAIHALGQIGNRDALAALQGLSASADQTAALTVCAYHLINGGHTAEARPVLTALLEEDTLSRHNRNAALRGLLTVDPEQGMRHIWTMLADETQSAVAFNVLGSVPGNKKLIADILDHFDGLPASTQIALLSILGGTAQPEALPKVLTLAQTSGNPALKETALVALGQLPGNKASLAFLCAEALNADGGLAKQAHAALVATPGTEAEDLMIGGIATGNADARIEYMEVAVARKLERACPALLKSADDADPAVRKAAYDALRTLAGPEQYEALIALLLAAPDDVQDAAARAVLYAGRKIDDPDLRTAPVLAALKTHSNQLRAALAPVLRDIGNATTLAVVTGYATSDSEPLRSAAIEELGKWKDPLAIDTVLELATATQDTEQRVQLMKAFSGLIANAKDVSPEKKLDQCKQALALGLDTNGKRAILRAVANVMDARALELIEELGSDPELAQAAKDAAPSIKQRLLGDPALSASHNPTEVGLAIDGDPRSGWSSGATMEPGHVVRHRPADAVRDLRHYPRLHSLQRRLSARLRSLHQRQSRRNRQARGYRKRHGTDHRDRVRNAREGTFHQDRPNLQEERPLLVHPRVDCCARSRLRQRTHPQNRRQGSPRR